jgi:hypothetical protein
VIRITDRQGYECMRPSKETNNENLVRLVKKFAASWQPCLAGWKEDYFADLKYTGFEGYTFSNRDKKIVFYTLGGEIVFAFSDHIPNLDTAPKQGRTEVGVGLGASLLSTWSPLQAPLSTVCRCAAAQAHP